MFTWGDMEAQESGPKHCLGRTEIPSKGYAEIGKDEEKLARC